MSIAQKATSAMIWDFFGKSGLTLIRFAESILLIRMMGSGEYGLLSEFLNFQASLVLLGSLGLEGLLSRFIPEFKLQDKAKLGGRLIRQVTVFRTGLLLLLAGGFYGLAEPLLGWLFKASTVDVSQHVLSMQVVAFLVISVGLQDLMRRILVVHYQQRLINIVEFVAFSAYLIVAVFVLWKGWGIHGVLLANLGSKVFILFFFGLYSRSYFKSTSPTPTFPPALQKRLIAFATNFYFYSLTLYILGKGSDIYILGAFVGASEVAHYRIAFEFSFFSISFFELALMGGFMLPLITEVMQGGDREQAKRVYTGLFEFLYLFIIPICVGGALLADDLVVLLYGIENRQAVPLLILFYLHFGLTKIGVLNATFMLASDQTKKLIASRLFFGLFNVVLNLVLVGPYQTLGVVIGTLVTGLLASIYESWCLHQLIHPRYSLTFLWKILLASGVMGSILWTLSPFLEIFLAAKVTLLVLIGGGCYLGMLVGLKPISPSNLAVLKHSKIPFKNRLSQLFSKPTRD